MKNNTNNINYSTNEWIDYYFLKNKFNKNNTI